MQKKVKTFFDINPDFAILQHFEGLLKNRVTEADYMKAVKYRNAPWYHAKLNDYSPL